MKGHLRFAGISGVGFWMILMLAIAMGANTGYTAESIEDTRMEFNGTHLTVGDNVSDVRLDWDEPPESEESKMVTRGSPFLNEDLEVFPQVESETADQFTRASVEQTYIGMMYFAIGAADLMATYTYQNLRWVPAPIFEGWLVFATISVPAWYIVRRYRELRD